MAEVEPQIPRLRAELRDGRQLTGPGLPLTSSYSLEEEGTGYLSVPLGKEKGHGPKILTGHLSSFASTMKHQPYS